VTPSAAGTEGTLFVVATPIGNLDDLSPRVRAALASAELVVAEDTRRTHKLLSHVGLGDKPLERLDAHASEGAIERIAQRIASGAVIALCTDAGTPGVSDPGAALVARVRSLGGAIAPLPGPSAVTTALSASGYATQGFWFAGFLPRAGMDRTRFIADVAAFRQAVVLFESPQRIGPTLQDLAFAMPGRRALVARELTKLHEELVEDELATLADRYRDAEVLGEITLVLGPWSPAARVATEPEVEAKIEEALTEGLRARDAAERVAIETGWSKRDVYALIVRRKR